MLRDPHALLLLLLLPWRRREFVLGRPTLQRRGGLLMHRGHADDGLQRLREDRAVAANLRNRGGQVGQPVLGLFRRRLRTRLLLRLPWLGRAAGFHRGGAPRGLVYEGVDAAEGVLPHARDVCTLRHVVLIFQTLPECLLHDEAQLLRLRQILARVPKQAVQPHQIPHCHEAIGQLGVHLERLCSLLERDVKRLVPHVAQVALAVLRPLMHAARTRALLAAARSCAPGRHRSPGAKLEPAGRRLVGDRCVRLRALGVLQVVHLRRDIIGHVGAGSQAQGDAVLEGARVSARLVGGQGLGVEAAALCHDHPQLPVGQVEVLVLHAVALGHRVPLHVSGLLDLVLVHKGQRHA
mmetsp:Transcript_7674/g.19490  ORF Transcript_7674/g.19490 Transcript_7674/m.19490 type:complete len:351 (+) Transcript_7674:199-1251(+)